MRRIAEHLGMADSRFEKGYFTTTLDDMAKLVWTLMNNGVYGGERCIGEGDCEALRAKMIATYTMRDRWVRYIFSTNVGEMVVLMNLDQKDAEFVITK